MPRSGLILTFLTLAAAGSSLFGSPTAQASDYFLHLWSDRHEPAESFRLTPAISYYTSKLNYDTGGTQFVPSGFSSYNRIQFDVDAAYGWKPWFTAFARASWANVQVNGDTNPGNAFGFTDQLAGFNIRVWEEGAKQGLDSVGIDLQGQVEFPGYSNAHALSLSPSPPLLGDQSVDVTGGAFITIPFFQGRAGRWLAIAGGGYMWRSNGFSPAVPWSATLEYKPRADGLYIGGTVAGLASLRAVSPSGSGITGDLTSFDGGSFVSGSQVPSIALVRGELGYQISEGLGVGAFAMQPFWGKSAPQGFDGGLNLSLRFDTGSKRAAEKKSTTSADYDGSNKGFVDYSFEAHVVRSNDRLNLVKIDKGKQDGVEVGQIFDIFLIKQDGQVGDAVARAKVVSVKESEAALQVTEYYKEVLIEEGFLAKRPIQ